MIYGVYSIKGGVGKSSTAVNLAYLAAESGKKTLLWDLDPQGSSTFFYHLKQGKDVKIRKVISGEIELPDLIHETGYSLLSVVPSDFKFRHIDAILDDVKKSRKRLNEILKKVKGRFDVIILDCPPGISLLSENVFLASDFVLVPTVPSPLSLRTLEQIEIFFQENELRTEKILPFFSMVDRRKKFHLSTIDKLGVKGYFLRAGIPFLSMIEKMGVEQKPLVHAHPGSTGAIAYRELWKEIVFKTM